MSLMWIIKVKTTVGSLFWFVFISGKIYADLVYVMYIVHNTYDLFSKGGLFFVKTRGFAKFQAPRSKTVTA